MTRQSSAVKSIGHQLAYLLGLFLTTTAVVTAPQTLAQSPPPSCQPPQSDELLLLVVTETSDAQEKIRSTLPSQMETSLCTYLGNRVTRVGGFRRFEEADSWVRHINDNTGLLAVVVKLSQFSPQPAPSPPTITTRPPVDSIPTVTTPVPPTNTITTPPPTTATKPVTNNSATVPEYNPQPLGSGYAVLVDYFNNPEVAVQLQEVLGQNIGLASYFARPYLLVVHTQSETDANSRLRNLSDRGFSAVVVDSNRVTLLTPAVK